MKVYLIDPFEKKITEVEYDGNLVTIYSFLDCQTMDVARLEDTTDSLFVDDEGLHVEEQKFFSIRGYPQPLPGKALFVGLNEEGETVEPIMPLSELKHLVRFGDLVKFSSGYLVVGKTAAEHE